MQYIEEIVKLSREKFALELQLRELESRLDRVAESLNNAIALAEGFENGYNQASLDSVQSPENQRRSK